MEKNVIHAVALSISPLLAVLILPRSMSAYQFQQILYMITLGS